MVQKYPKKPFFFEITKRPISAKNSKFSPNDKKKKKRFYVIIISNTLDMFLMYKISITQFNFKENIYEKNPFTLSLSLHRF